MLNLVAISPQGSGNLRIAPTNADKVNGGVVNFSDTNNSNALPVGLSTEGKTHVFVNGGGTHVRGVALGYFTTQALAPSGLVFVPVTPKTCFDTRPSQGGTGILGGSTSRNFQVTGSGHEGQGGLTGGCGVPANASGVMVNLVAITPNGGGNLKIAASNATAIDGGIVNYQDDSNSNAVPVSLSGSGQVNVAANGFGSHVRGVALGYFITPNLAPDGLKFIPIVPQTCFDTRPSQGGSGAMAGGFGRNFIIHGANHAGQGGNTIGCGVPISAEAVMLNLVAIAPSASGNLRAAALNASAINGGVVNYVDQANSNALPVGISGAGNINVFANGGTSHVRGVALGYFQ